jgi:hypothetical protein
MHFVGESISPSSGAPQAVHFFSSRFFRKNVSAGIPSTSTNAYGIYYRGSLAQGIPGKVQPLHASSDMSLWLTYYMP